MWCNLFYDKFAGDFNSNGDHHYNNPITNKVSLNDLEDGSFNYYSGKEALLKYNSKFKGYFTLPDFLYQSDLFKLNMYTKLIDAMETIYVVIGINTIILENYVTNNNEIPSGDFIKTLCRYHLAYINSNKFITNSFYYNNNTINQKIQQNMDYIIEKANIAVDYSLDDRINKSKEINVELFEYQKCSINWMIEKEKNKPKVTYNLNDEVILGNVYYDIFQSFNLIKNRKNLQFLGGAIIDEVGLGKTLQIILLGILNPPTSVSYTRENCNKFFSKATIVFCPNQLCGQWVRELQDKINDDFEAKIISIMTKRDFDKLTYNDLLDADFIIVSFTFLDNKVFTNSWTSKISTFKNFHKQKWSSSDISLVTKLFDEMSSNLVKDPINSLYKTNPLIQLIHWHRIVIDEFHEIYKDDNTYSYISNLLPFIKGDNKWCVTATPFNKKICLYKIMDFLCDYKNTDGENILRVEKIVDYLSTDCFRRNSKESVKNEHTIPQIKEEIRWLKFSPTERMIYNAYLTDPNNNKFSVYLRQLCCHPQLADETKEALSNCKTLTDIEKMMVSHYKLQMDESQEKVDKINDRINKINKKIKKIEKKQMRKQIKKMGLKMEKDKDDDSDDDNSDSGSDIDLDEEINLLLSKNNMLNMDLMNNKPSLTIENLKDTIKTLEIKLKEATVILEGKKSTFNFFNNVIDRIRKTVNKDTDKEQQLNNFNPKLNPDTNVMNMLSKEVDNDDDEICGICLDEIPEDDIGVTNCGHIFCFQCLKLTIIKYHSCPYCKKKLSEKDIYILSYERKKKDEKISQEDKNKADLINEIGTKLANLITYIRESDEHTIIFSQWDDLLRRVGRILRENNILNVFCKGNCYQRDKAIREFNNDDKIKVIMLSSESTAAGTNLTKAKQVIFIDPIYGDYKFRKDQEKQAIGRAHRLGQKSSIKIIRFIIKDTVEEEIYRLNVTEDNKHTHDLITVNEIEII